ncbi:cold shock domain-containing protein [Acinetobacter guillouiae]|uniref:cold shock domain-containing protein n=1 Tax=Acinetobacter guillouiae TaxID=106649 RepID=UPI003AF72826
MFTEGIIKTYNEEKGFGFIQIEDQKKDLFFHIKDFPNKQQLPQIGEKLKFRIVSDNNGKMKAENIIRLDLKVKEINSISTYRTSYRSNRKPKEKKFNFISLLIGLVIFSIFLAILLPFLSDIYQRETLKRQVAEPTNRASSSMNTNTNVTSKYSCDGRVHCSQMKSYDEAVFFINNCPGTKMDGDGDGDPCEGQFR